MRFCIVAAIVFTGCKQPINHVIDNSAKLAEQNIKDAQANTKRLDSILTAVKYMVVRDSFMIVAHGLEVLYYKTEKEKYRINHNKLVDSINKYNKLFMSQLNKK